MAYNKVILEGHLGKDCDSRFTPEGKAVTKFSLAVNNGKDKKPVWVTITTWENLAEACTKALHAGSRVLIEGRLTEPGAWINQSDNLPRASIEVTASTVVFLDKKESE
jgi:single-strand DNA-binding protein